MNTNHTPTICYIGLGSNLCNPIEQIRQAIASLDCIEQSYILSYSSFYQSAPMGPQDQPAFINAVAKLATGLEPLTLLDELHTIENQQGRKRASRWGARTLDLDLLLYGNTIINTQRLTVPHYGMKERDFVLQPLAEISPTLVMPCGESIKELLKHCENYGLKRLVL